MVIVVKFHVQVQNNFPKQEDSGDARTLGKDANRSGTRCFFAILTRKNARDLVDPMGSSQDA